MRTEFSRFKDSDNKIIRDCNERFRLGNHLNYFVVKFVQTQLFHNFNNKYHRRYALRIFIKKGGHKGCQKPSKCRTSVSILINPFI